MANTKKNQEVITEEIVEETIETPVEEAEVTELVEEELKKRSFIGFVKNHKTAFIGGAIALSTGIAGFVLGKKVGLSASDVTEIAEDVVDVAEDLAE